MKMVTLSSSASENMGYAYFILHVFFRFSTVNIHYNNVEKVIYKSTHGIFIAVSNLSYYSQKDHKQKGWSPFQSLHQKLSWSIFGTNTNVKVLLSTSFYFNVSYIK